VHQGKWWLCCLFISSHSAWQCGSRAARTPLDIWQAHRSLLGLLLTTFAAVQCSALLSWGGFNCMLFLTFHRRCCASWSRIPL
jgi:hypothetical protein